MKKTLLLTLALLLSFVIHAQNNINIISEEFDSDAIPEGWSTTGNGAKNWYVSKSFSAGGKPNEMMLQWSPAFSGISRLVSPAVDLSGLSNAMLSLKHYVAIFSGTAKIGVATSSDDGTTWNSVWSESYNKTESHTIVCNISGPDMGKKNVRFCIYFEGSSSVIQSWYFDDFKVYTVENINIEMTNIDMPDCISQGEHEINFSIKNTGESAIKTFEARCNINGEETFSETFYTEVAYNETKQFSFEDPYHFTFGEDYNINIEVFRINDDDFDGSDKAIEKDITTALSETQRTPMIEHFSSATCGPCVSANYGMSVLTENNPGKYTYAKYPMNWPNQGDPYYTEESGNKRLYYNISGAPELYLDGALQGNTYFNNDIFIEQYETPALANVRGAFTVNGNTINIVADFMTYFNANDVTAYIAVNEKTTTGNSVPTSNNGNGETEFHHIMMKMLPDANGSKFDIKAGEYQHLEFSFDMTQTFMEDINDLEVALWLQNDETKEIYNSHFAYEYTEHCYPIRNLKTWISGNNFTAKWDTPEKGNPIGYNVIIDGKLVAEKITSLEYTSELKNKKVVEIMAVYNNDMTSIGIVKQITSEEKINNITINNKLIYPNPVNDRLFIEAGIEIEEIAVYDIYGRRQQNLSAVSRQSSVIDVSNLKSGIYFIKINTEKGNIVKRIIKN